MTAPLYHPRPERWPQVSLRAVLVVVTLFCVWLGMQAKWIHDRRAARVWISQHQPKADSKARYVAFYSKPARFPWVLRFFGEQPVDSIWVAVGPGEDDEAERLQTLFPEADFHADSRQRAGEQHANDH